jgi:hypothetical protein
MSVADDHDFMRKVGWEDPCVRVETVADKYALKLAVDSRMLRSSSSRKVDL